MLEIARALLQRRDLHLEHLQPVVEIRGDDPRCSDVALHADEQARRVGRPGLEVVHERALQRGARGSDALEKQAAFARAVHRGVGPLEEHARHLVVAVSEQVEREERLLATRAAIVDDARDDRAARPVVAEDPHRCVAARDQPHAAEQLPDLRAVAGEQRLVRDEIDRLAQPFAVEDIGEVVDDRERAVELERALELIDHVGVRGHPGRPDEHELDPGSVGVQHRDEARAVGQLGIGEHEVGCDQGIARAVFDRIARTRET